MHENKHLRAMVLSLGFVTICAASGREQNQLWKIQAILASKNYVDLTHEFTPGIPHWSGFPDETRNLVNRPGEEMGEGARANPRWCVRCAADRLVEALA
jgi:hypothetical protein